MKILQNLPEYYNSMKCPAVQTVCIKRVMCPKNCINLLNICAMRQMLDAVGAFVYNEHNSARVRGNGPARRKSTGRGLPLARCRHGGYEREKV